MNERILEIAKQAGAHWNHGDFNMGSSVEFQESDLEKFAELIVKECVHKMQNDYYGDSLDDICKQIKKDFGVEE